MWITREVDAPAERAWAVLVDLDRWPAWGPSVAEARLDDGSGGRRLTADSHGRVRPFVGPWIPFRVDAFDDGRSWSWRVAGVPATRHRVEPLGPDRCEVAFFVPVWALPYAVVCRVALRRIDGLLTT
ncbi:SRPBCC family protein [soil metagenome]